MICFVSTRALAISHRMPPSSPAKDGFAPHVLCQLVGHISPMHYFDFGSVVVVEDHCRHLESAERHATPRRAWGGGRALIPDFRSRGVSHRPGTPGPFEFGGSYSAPYLKAAHLCTVATCAPCASPNFPGFWENLRRQLSQRLPRA